MNNLSERLINLSARLMLASSVQERLDISSEIAEIAKCNLAAPEDDNVMLKGFLKFTEKEISKMPKQFKKEFITNGAVAHVRKRRSGKHTFVYEIRYRKQGYNIYAASTNLETAKEKFIEKLKFITQYAPGTAPKLLFDDIAQEWFAWKKSKISKEQYRAYLSYYKNYIYPFIGNKKITEIRTAELTEIMKQCDGKGRAYEDVRSVLNQVFKYAIINNIIQQNPVQLVDFIKADRTPQKSLTKKEIAYFLKKIYEPEFDNYRIALLLELYFGLRPCETRTARIDGDFLIAQNAKRKKGKIEYKKIPFSQMAKQHITRLPQRNYSTETLNIMFRKIFPEKTQYCLRHTFSSKCQEFVRQEIVEVWIGDSPERLIGKTYTHLSDEFMLDEMSRVIY